MSKDNASVARLPVGIIVLSAAMIAVVWAALIFDIVRSEKSAIRKAGSDAGNLAIAFRENVGRTVSAIDQMMIAIIAETNEFGKQYQIPEWVAGNGRASLDQRAERDYDCFYPRQQRTGRYFGPAAF
jgi:hypothetical protein